MIFFVDENISYRAAQILEIFDRDNEIRAHRDYFSPATPDVTWLAQISEWDPKPVVVCGDGRILRGDIVWAGLNPVRGHEQARQRPVLVLSQDVFNRHSGTVIAAALTSQPQEAGFSLTLELAHPRLSKRSWGKISQIRTLSVERLGQRIGKASSEELSLIVEGLNEIIDP